MKKFIINHPIFSSLLVFVAMTISALFVGILVIRHFGKNDQHGLIVGTLFMILLFTGPLTGLVSGVLSYIFLSKRKESLNN